MRSLLRVDSVKRERVKVSEDDMKGLLDMKKWLWAFCDNDCIVRLCQETINNNQIMIIHVNDRYNKVL